MVQLLRVTKAYPGNAPSLVDVTLQIGKGEFLFLTGPSGAGKTTLLRLMFSAEAVTQGEVRVGGKNIARIRESAIPYLRRNVGVVFQDFKLLPDRTVAENVALALEVLGVPSRICRERVVAMLKRVGLESKASLRPQHLSGGEQQRVVIARALVNEPTLLLADEPTGNLDPALTIEIMDLLNDATGRGTTVVVATHDESLLSRYQKRTVRLEGGRIVSDSKALRAVPDPSPGLVARDAEQASR